MLMSADFVLSVRQDVLTLPVTALTSGRGVWAVDAEDRVEYRTLEEARIIGSYLLVAESDIDGVFVTEGQHFLSDGVEVRILDGKSEEKDKAATNFAGEGGGDSE